MLGVLALLAYAPQGSAIIGIRRRTAVVAYAAGVATVSREEAVAAQEQAAAQESAAAAAQESAAAQQQAAAHPPAPHKTPQQKLEELQALYKQGLISESDYNAAKAKILAQIAQ